MKASRLERLMQMSASEIHKSDCLRFERKYNSRVEIIDHPELAFGHERGIVRVAFVDQIVADEPIGIASGEATAYAVGHVTATFATSCAASELTGYNALTVHSLTPTQDEISLDNLRELLAADAQGAALPPIKVVRVGSELRILDGHHRACVAALLSRDVLAVVLDIGNESARIKACK